MEKLFLAFVILFTASSCNYLQERATPHIKTLHPPGRNEITTVAILPFKNKTGKKGSEEILRKCFFINFSTKGYQVLRLEEIDERLNLAAINASNIEKEDVYKVGKIVKADALIYGVVTECYKRCIGVYSLVVFGAEMKMVDATSTKVIWQADHTEKTYSDSIPVSLLSIPEAVIDSSMNIREKVIADTANRLAKKFVDSIPSKDFSSTINANVINIKSNNTSMEVYYRVQPGDTLSSISNKFYDNASKAMEISKSNKGVLDASLKARRELIIPDMPILSDIAASQQIDRNKHKKVVYRVKWGDSLYEIASKVFRDGKKWTVIYNANKCEITNIKDLPVGQVLIVPLTIPKSGSF